MKKKVTKAEVERALSNLRLVSDKLAGEILNELFPPEFKVGDKVMVTKIPESDHWICDDERRLFTLKGGIESGFYGTRGSGDMHGLKGCEFRHATPEEIAAAEWESGKPYKVWDDGKEALVRISSDEVGLFYRYGLFSGGCHAYDKYEKL